MTTNGELWSCRQCACLRHCLGQGLGSGVGAGRAVTAGMAAGSRPWWFGDRQAGCGCAAARFGARSSMYVLLSYCVLTCTRVRVGVVQCGLVIPASYEARGICCPY